MSDFHIRPYHPSDLPMLYRICLLTSDSGEDGSHLYQDPDLVGHLYVAPYAVLEPELCFILTHLGQPCGYVLGTKNSVAFSERCEQEWFPTLRERANTDYPAHLHIDLLPIAQGKGWGRKMMTPFLEKLRELKISGVELGVSKQNTRAVRFYEAVGFTRLEEAKNSFDYGLKLTH